MALAAVAGEAEVEAGVEVEAASAVAEECPAVEAPAVHGDDKETAAEIHRQQSRETGDRTSRGSDIRRDRGVCRSVFLGQRQTSWPGVRSSAWV